MTERYEIPNGAPTPPLAEFRAEYDKDDNIWWTVGCGHHMNLFDAALEEIDALRESMDLLKAELARVGTVAQTGSGHHMNPHPSPYL